MKIYYHSYPEGDELRFEDPVAAPRTDATYVYFLERAGDGAVKVGHSKDPVRRLKQLQTGSADPLRLLCCIEAPRSMETWLHRDLRGSRISGEWYGRASAARWLQGFLSGCGDANALIF